MHGAIRILEYLVAMFLFLKACLVIILVVLYACMPPDPGPQRTQGLGSIGRPGSEASAGDKDLNNKTVPVAENIELPAEPLISKSDACTNSLTAPADRTGKQQDKIEQRMSKEELAFQAFLAVHILMLVMPCSPVSLFRR